jgi:hypothetical protein
MAVKLSWRTRLEKIEKRHAPGDGRWLVWVNLDLSDRDRQLAHEMLARGEELPERFLTRY